MHAHGTMCVVVSVKGQRSLLKVKRECTELETELEEEKKALFIHHEGQNSLMCVFLLHMYVCMYIVYVVCNRNEENGDEL